MRTAPYRTTCDRCAAPIMLARRSDAPARRVALDLERVEGGAWMTMGEFADQVPPGPGPAYQAHRCAVTGVVAPRADLA